MTNSSIVTLTMNPAVDLSTDVEKIEPTHKLRCGAVRRDAGGGGINVARAIRRLGGDPLAIYPAGGHTGRLLHELVGAEGVRRKWIPIAGETRENIAVREQASGEQFRFVLRGPALGANELEACLDAVSGSLSQASYLVASGSLPVEAPADFYRRVAMVAATHGARFVLDTSGDAFKAALGQRLHLVKPSRREFSELLGCALESDAACLAAAQRFAKTGGAEFVALSLGEEGALLVGNGVALRANAPRVQAVSTVGAGDSFLGAMVLSFSRGEDLSTVLRRAVAAGTASLLSPGTGLCRAEDAERLMSEVTVSQL